jgi:hypothetical protein
MSGSTSALTVSRWSLPAIVAGVLAGASNPSQTSVQDCDLTISRIDSPPVVTKTRTKGA